MGRLIAQSLKEPPHAPLMESLPGAGRRLAPAPASTTSVAACGQGDIESVRCVSGVAPVEDKSGKRQRATIRRRCNRRWRNLMHLFAHCSTAYCAWAKAFYDLRREQGDRRVSALRKLADKCLKTINHMIATGGRYDEDRYLQALRRGGSLVCLRL